MVSKNINTSASHVRATFDLLSENAKTPKTKVMLSQINEACATVSKGSVVSIAAVVKMLNGSGIKITKRTIYNQREGGNPYRELIDAWIEHSELLHTKDSTLPVTQALETPIDDSDLAKIDDISLRHKFSLMYGELKGLRNQLNIAREIKSLPMINAAQPQAIEGSSELILGSNLSDYDVEVIEKLIKTAPSNPLCFNEDGALVAKRIIKRGEILSLEGLLEILDRITK